MVCLITVGNGNRSLGLSGLFRQLLVGWFASIFEARACTTLTAGTGVVLCCTERSDTSVPRAVTSLDSAILWDFVASLRLPLQIIAPARLRTLLFKSRLQADLSIPSSVRHATTTTYMGRSGYVRRNHLYD